MGDRHGQGRHARSRRRRCTRSSARLLARAGAARPLPRRCESSMEAASSRTTSTTLMRQPDLDGALVGGASLQRRRLRAHRAVHRLIHAPESSLMYIVITIIHVLACLFLVLRRAAADRARAPTWAPSSAARSSTIFGSSRRRQLPDPAHHGDGDRLHADVAEPDLRLGASEHGDRVRLPRRRSPRRRRRRAAGTRSAAPGPPANAPPQPPQAAAAEAPQPAANAAPRRRAPVEPAAN